jgi:endonuclease/exonuclease/phosphatase (EEP) superfamily protein YafD
MIPVGKRLYDTRNTQLSSLVELLDDFSGNKVLVGDLNASVWDIHYRNLEKRSGLRSARRGFGIQPTWPTFLPFAMIPIDHVLVSSEISVSDVRTGRRIGSDHLPLVVTIEL